VLTFYKELTVQELTTHSDSYKLLAACFYEPDKKLFEEEQVCANLAKLLNDVAPEAVPSALAMHAALSEIDNKELLIDYAQLFVGPFELLAPPYGSVYLDGKRQVMGDSTMAVLQHYQEAGLAIDIKEPADHIAFELEFLHYLSALEADATLGKDQDKQQSFGIIKHEFLMTFLAPWVPEFCEKVRRGATCSFYKHLADCLQKTIECFSSDIQFSPVQRSADRGEDACRSSA